MAVYNLTQSRLPVAFVGKASEPIKRKPRSKPSFSSLPFVAGSSSDVDAPNWNVYAAGGYFGGYETGEAMAMSFLKFLREEKSDYPVYLTGIVESFMVRFEQEGGKAMKDRSPSEWSDGFDSLRGQYVGFFNTLSHWLVASAKYLGGNLDQVSEQDLVRRANAGLGFDHVAHMASLPDEDEK